MIAEHLSNLAANATKVLQPEAAEAADAVDVENSLAFAKDPHQVVDAQVPVVAPVHIADEYVISPPHLAIRTEVRYGAPVVPY